MLRKTILAFAAVTALGSAALVPTTASATRYGHGWYGYGTPYYGHYGWNRHYAYPSWGYYGPRHFYGGKLGWRKPYGHYD